MNFRVIGMAFAACLLVACANPSITNVSPAVAAKKGKLIYVTRFEGNPNFVEEATDMFVSKLTGLNAIQGDSPRAEGADIVAGGNIPERSLSLAAARSAGAEILVVGKVTSHKTDAMLNGFVTVRLIDVHTGQILGTIHRPSGMLIGNSEHQAVMAAAARVGGEVAKQLR